jgi:hypothetical protein
MPYRPTNFRSIVIKPYYILPEIPQEKKEEIEGIKSLNDDKDESIDTEKQSIMKYPMVIIH